MNKKYFGTDGIRGKVGEYPITADFLLKLGWATGKVFADESKGFVIVGKDTRISGYMFESALEAGLASAGVDTHLLGPMPTPGVAYLTRTLRAHAGIVISASHNPYYDNGIKFFSVQGTKLPDDIELKIEHYLDSPMTTVESASLGKAKRISDAAGRYIEFCKSTIPTAFDLSDMRLVVDCAHGSTYHIAPHVFNEVGAEVVAIGAEPNGLNINDDCGATKPEQLVDAVLQYRADLGIALDGDGDRVIMVDHKGEIVDGDELIYIIARSRKNKGCLSGPVIGTLMTNLGLEHALAEIDVKLHRAKVGDRFVMEMLQQHKGIIGGENSGHIICLDRTTTGDGIVSALQVLGEMYQTGKSLHDLKKPMDKYPQVLLNLKTDKKVNPDKLPAVQKLKQEIEKKLGDSGRILLRASGTEPLIRVMVEGIEEEAVRNYAQELVKGIKNSLPA